MPSGGREWGSRPWRGGRVVECTRLESEHTARYREFESPPLRWTGPQRGYSFFSYRTPSNEAAWRVSTATNPWLSYSARSTGRSAAVSSRISERPAARAAPFAFGDERRHDPASGVRARDGHLMNVPGFAGRPVRPPDVVGPMQERDSAELVADRCAHDRPEGQRIVDEARVENRGLPKRQPAIDEPLRGFAPNPKRIDCGRAIEQRATDDGGLYHRGAFGSAARQTMLRAGARYVRRGIASARRAVHCRRLRCRGTKRQSPARRPRPRRRHVGKSF